MKEGKYALTDGYRAGVEARLADRRVQKKTRLVRLEKYWGRNVRLIGEFYELVLAG